MEVFRICQAAHAGALISSGNANRWNRRGQLVIYAGSSRSLATLEVIVHRSSIVPTVPYRVVIISIADDDRFIRQLRNDELPADWRSINAYPQLQTIGGDWYDNQETLILKVPSVVIPYEYNIVINTEHPDFNDNVQRIRDESYFFDDRLIH